MTVSSKNLNPFIKFTQQIVAFSFIFLFFFIANAQVPMTAKDNKSTVNFSEFERINLNDGQFGFNLPLASIGGRGLGNGIALNLGQRWRRDGVITGYSGATPNVTERIEPDPYALNGLFPQAGGYLVIGTSTVSMTEIPYCSNETLYFAAEKSVSVAFNGFGGQSFSFISTQNDGDTIKFTGQSCLSHPTQSIGSVFIATDGSGTKFISDGAISLTDDLMGNGYGDPNIYPGGVIKFANGTTYRIDGGLVSWIEDTNGNRTTLTNTGFSNDIRENRVTSIKDPLNREIQTTSDANFKYVSYAGTGGASRTIKLSNISGGTSTQMLNSILTWMPSNHPSNRLLTCNTQNYVELPNGKRYTFTYDCMGYLSKVEFPTGGSIEYDYEMFCPTCYGSLVRRISERRVYLDGVSLDNKTKYEYSPVSTPPEVWTKVKLYDSQNNLKSVSKHNFVGCLSGSNCYVLGTWYQSGSDLGNLLGREFNTEMYGSDGTTLLRKTETVFEPRRRATWVNSQQYPPYLDFRVTSVTNTLADSAQVSKVIYSYDSTAPYNLLTDTFEYDYGSNQPGSFLRRTHTDYEKGASYTANTVNILNLPTQTWVSSDVNGASIVSRSAYEYDNYTNDATHAPLVDRSLITGHTSSFGTGYATRGNLTKTTSYATAATSGGAVSTYNQYDIAGNVVKTIDARGYASTADYSDRYGLPNSDARQLGSPLTNQSTFAFASSVTNAAGWTTYVQRDFYTGGVVDTEDITGNISTTYYSDVLDRPTQTIGNNNRPTLRSQATVAYDDIGKKVTVTADSKTYGDNLIKTEAYYDGFGRTIESRDYETSSNYVTALTQYDSLGRAYRSCNPYRPYLSETAQWTTTNFDSLGRVTTITTADNATVTRGYAGTTVTVRDQAGRSRSGVSDAVGRLTKVTEYNGGTQYDSLYTYDVLGRLRKTAQTSGATTQNRYFMYDDLGRLIRAKQVEQGINSSLNLTDSITGNTGWSVKYDYDNNGNITSTTDALNRAIVGTYDSLNRLTFRDYSDLTADVTFTYENQNIANSRGKMTAVNSSVSATNYTAFDVLGRIKSSSQTTGGQTYAMADYSYDLSRALVSQAYPSGRVVTTETDNIGRLSRVASQTTGQVQKTMLSNLDYTSFGAVKQAKLGNGKWESAQFDPKRLQVTQIGLGGSAGDTSLLKLEFGYGTTSNNGSLLQQKITVPGATQIVQDYTYDNLNRLYSATESVNSVQQWKQTFDIDRFGNRRFDAGNTTTFGSCPQASCNPGIDLNKNQFSTSDGYGYDAEGNLTASGADSQIFTYDGENRQTQVYNSATQTTASYQYDGNGKRVKKVDGTKETIFVYDAFGKLLAEYTINQPLTQNGTQYLTADALGSPRIATNAIGGVASRHDYMPFGEEVMAGLGGRTTGQGYGQPDNARQKFTGYERDTESGLDFAQNRYFSAKHARFTSVDPLAASADPNSPQSLNRYSYGNNSPYMFTDPDGLEPCGTEAEFGRTCTQTDDYETDDGFNRTLGIETERAEGRFQEMKNNSEAGYGFITNAEYLPFTSLDFPIVYELYDDGSLWTSFALVTNAHVVTRYWHQKGFLGDLGDWASRAANNLTFGAVDYVNRNVHGMDDAEIARQINSAPGQGGENFGIILGIMLPGPGKAKAANVVFGHGARHLAGTGLSKTVVEGAIRTEVRAISQTASQTGIFRGRIAFSGTTIEYRAFTLPNGTINIGTYYVPR